MISSPPKTSLCAMCGEGPGNFMCRGCSQDFCASHVIEHRQALGKRLNEITLEHDQLCQNIADYRKDPYGHPLIKQIDDWQKKSVNVIVEIATELRNKLRHNMGKASEKTTSLLEPLSQQLNKIS